MWSAKHAIYVSRFSGKDSAICGTPLLPCRTINYALNEVSDGLLIYLDGTRTKIDPYTCQSLNHSHSGIYLTKSVSFVGIKSRAYISCLQGNQWLADGVKYKDGLIISFSGVAFWNTSLRFLDASVHINDTLFIDSRHAAIDFTAVNVTLVSLSLNNVVFQQNILCISVDSNKKISIFLRLTNSTFTRNGNSSSDLASILWWSSEKSDAVIQFRNCSLKENESNEYGIVFVNNQQGSTDFSIHQFKLEDNGQRGAVHGNPRGLITSLAAQVVMTLEFGFVYKTYGTLLTVNGQSSKINMLNTNINEFYSSYTGSGVINMTNSVLGSLSIQNSFLRNGKSLWLGGVVSITAPKLNLTIQNSTFENISSTECGGVVSFYSDDIYKTSYRTKVFEAELNIINSSFIDNVSRYGGVLCGVVENVFANITDSLFLRNIARELGAALSFVTSNAAGILLDNVRFMENRAGIGGIVRVRSMNKSNGSTCNFTTNKVWFVKNKVSGHDTDIYCILELLVTANTLNFLLKNSYFIDNTAKRSTVICKLQSNSIKIFHSITINKCTFKKNFAEFGALRVVGFATVFCNHSLFDSNIYIPCRGPAFGILMADSEITIANSKFVNNSCGAISAEGNDASYLKIENSIFLRNRRMGGSGGAIAIFIKTNDKNKEQNPKRRGIFRDNNVYIQNVWFEKNMAAGGSILTVDNGKMKLSNCVFINNFAHSQGGQISSYGSNEMKIFNCVFKETVGEKIIVDGTKFSGSGFLGIHGSGMFQLQNTTSISNVLSNEPIVSVTKAKGILIDNSSTTTCPLGSGIKLSFYYYKDSNHQMIEILDLSCRRCRHNYYSLQRGYSDGLHPKWRSFVCTPCPRGADCFPAIKSRNNFWGYLVNLNPPKLAFTICPFGYCKSPEPPISNYNECEGQRKGIMCGMCSIGYTETLLSTYCAPNKSCKEYWFWVVFLALVAGLAVLLVFKPPIITYSLKQVLWFKSLIFRSTSRQGHECHEVITCTSLHEETTHEIRPRSTMEQQKHEKRQFRQAFFRNYFLFLSNCAVAPVVIFCERFFWHQISPSCTQLL